MPKTAKAKIWPLRIVGVKSHSKMKFTICGPSPTLDMEMKVRILAVYSGSE
jgi:hypothetical protein